MGTFFQRKRLQSQNKKRALALHGLTIRYVTEMRDGEELVLGRKGVLSVHDGEIIVLSSGETVFRSPLAGLSVSYLMSGDGAILKGDNRETGQRDQEITVHFVDVIK